jgi:hypothetical protein
MPCLPGAKIAQKVTKRCANELEMLNTRKSILLAFKNGKKLDMAV